MIIREKVRKKEILSKGITNTTAMAEVAQALSFVDYAGKYI